MSGWSLFGVTGDVSVCGAVWFGPLSSTDDRSVGEGFSGAVSGVESGADSVSPASSGLELLCAPWSPASVAVPDPGSAVVFGAGWPESPTSAAVGESADAGAVAAESGSDAGAVATGSPVDAGVVDAGSLVEAGVVSPADAGAVESPTAGAAAAGAVAPGTSVPSSGTVGACAGDDPPDSIADCTPPAPALVNVSTPISRLNSRPRKAAPTPAAATWAETSAPSSVTAPPTILPVTLPTVEPAVSANAPVPPPNTPPTAPPTAPPKVASPRSVQPNLSEVRSPLETWIMRAARSTPPSSSASKAAPRNARRAAALAAPRESMRAMSCLIAIRIAICPATRAATPATAPTPVHDVASATASSAAVTIIVPMITSLVCSMSLAPSSSSSACFSHQVRTAVTVAWSPARNLSRKVAMAVWVSPSEIAVRAAFNATAA